MEAMANDNTGGNMRIVGKDESNAREEQGYVSESTIDRPPREPKDSDGGTDDGKQQALGDDKMSYEEKLMKDAESDLKPGERVVQIDLTLKIKEKGGKTYTLPICDTEIRSTSVRMILDTYYMSRRVAEQIDAILDLPPKKDEPQQTSLFGGLSVAETATDQDDFEEVGAADPNAGL